MSNSVSNTSKKYNLWIWILSIAVPVAVAVLFTVRIPGVERLGFLPPIYATINGLTAILLIAAVFQIRKGNRKAHERLMKTSIVLSVLFLVMYVAYHMTSDATKFGDSNGDGVLSEEESLAVGAIKYVYYFLLLTHITLSITVIPFVLIQRLHFIRNIGTVET